MRENLREGVNGNDKKVSNEKLPDKIVVISREPVVANRTEVVNIGGKHMKKFLKHTSGDVALGLIEDCEEERIQLNPKRRYSVVGDKSLHYPDYREMVRVAGYPMFNTHRFTQEEVRSVEVLYHGSDTIIHKPMLRGSRAEYDFGTGFYLTQYCDIAESWLCKRTNKVYINQYKLDMRDLKIKIFNLDEEFLLFIALNRNKLEGVRRDKIAEYFSDLKHYDVIFGPIADDRLYVTLSQFFGGFYDINQTLALISTLNLKEQYTLVSQKAIDNLHFIKGIEVPDYRLEYLFNVLIESNQAMSCLMDFVNKHPATNRMFIKDLADKWIKNLNS